MLKHKFASDDFLLSAVIPLVNDTDDHTGKSDKC